MDLFKTFSNHKKFIISVMMAFFIIVSIFCCFSGINIIANRTEGKNSVELILNKTSEGNIIRADYLDYNGIITFAIDKHYATIIKEINEKGFVIREIYYDENGNPAKQPSGYSGVLLEYDDNGNNNSITYIDSKGEPMITTSGYARINKIIDDDGNVVQESYADIYGQPVMCGSGYYYRIKEYNTEGKCTSISYLDEHGCLTRNSTGYATEKNILDIEGRIISVMYFDENNKPVKNIHGVYGVAYNYDDQGRKYREINLNADGKIMYNSSGYAIMEKTYGKNNDVLIEMYYDADCQPICLSHGQYGIKKVNGQIIYLDIDGNEVFFLDQFLHTKPLLVVVLGLLVCLMGVFVPYRFKIGLLILYVFFIVLMTLMYRGSGEPQAQLELFWSYKDFFSDRSARVDIIKNIWLFVPLGLLLFFLSSKRWMLFVPVILSFVVEVIQLITGRGLFEFDDIISNSIGGCLGFYFGELLQTFIIKIKQKPEAFNMYLTSEQEQMLELIRMSLWGGENPSVLLTPEIYQELKNHSIHSLLIPILSKINISANLQKDLEQTKLQHIAYFVKYKNVQNNLPVNVPYVILKGSSVAMYYPDPRFRVMGDIDIMTRREDFDMAYQQLLDDGYNTNKQLEREIGLVKNGVMIELHRFFALLSDPDQAAYMDDLIIDNINLSHILPDLVNGLVLLEHINQHLEGGLGLRQIIDWMMFVDKCLPDEQWSEFQVMSDRIGLTTLAIVTTRMCEIYLGLQKRNWCAEAETELCKQLLQYVLDSGNFGNKKKGNEDIAENVFFVTKTPRAAFELLQKRGLANWKAAQEYCFLRPFAWIYQTGRYVFRGINRKGAVHKLKSEYESAMRRSDMLDSLGVKQIREGRMVYRDGKYVKR